MFGSRKKNSEVQSRPIATPQDARPPLKGTGEQTNDPNAQSGPPNPAMLRFGEAISVLMRSPRYRNIRISDLEWLVIPPLMHNQVVIASASKKENKGVSIPIGLLLWARVSDQLDKQLRKEIEQFPPRLKPDDWKSGGNYWIIDALGDHQIVNQMLRQTQEVAFKGAGFSVRGVSAEGTPFAKNFGALTHAAPA